MHVIVHVETRAPLLHWDFTDFAIISRDFDAMNRKRLSLNEMGVLLFPTRARVTFVLTRLQLLESYN